MTGDDAMVVSSGDDHEEVVPPWLMLIASIAFYSPCKTHPSKNYNLYCRVCRVALCQECKMHHGSKHELIRAYKVHKVASFRIEDLKSLWDMSDIRSYPCNGYLVTYIRKNGARFHCQRSLANNAKCQSCPHRFMSPDAKYCSVECKVEAVTKMNGSESTKNKAKTKVETISVGSSSNAKSFRKRPRKQKNSQRAPFY